MCHKIVGIKKGGEMKEEIIAYADGSDYIHGELYETAFDTKHYSNVIFTKNIWKGKVKITIESLEKVKR